MGLIILCIVPGLQGLRFAPPPAYALSSPTGFSDRVPHRGGTKLQISFVIIDIVCIEERLVLVHERANFMVLLLIAYVLNHFGQY